MATKLERFSLGLHVDIPNRHRKDSHHHPEISNSYIANHHEIENNPHNYNKNPINLESRSRVDLISTSVEPSEEEEIEEQQNKCFKCLECTISPLFKFFYYLIKSKSYKTNILNNLQGAGIAKLNSDQAYNVNFFLKTIKTVHQNYSLGRHEKQANPLTREIQEKSNNNDKVLHISFYDPSIPPNPESEAEILDKSNIDFIQFYGIEDSTEELSKENLILIKKTMNKILPLIASNQYGFLVVNCEAGIFRSGSFVLMLLIFKSHLLLENGITRQTMINLFVENYQLCVGICKPHFKGIANKNLLNAMLRTLNVWAIKRYIYSHEIPLIDSDLSNQVDEKISEILSIKCKKHVTISGVLK